MSDLPMNHLPPADPAAVQGAASQPAMPQPASVPSTSVPSVAASPVVDRRPGLAFAGSGLDRAVGLRADPLRLAELAQDPRSRFLPFWRGQVLLAPDQDHDGAAARSTGPAQDPAAAPTADGPVIDPVVGRGLAALRIGAPLLDHARAAPLFLGLSRGVAVFAVDVSLWTPEAGGPAGGAAGGVTAPVPPPGVPEGVVFAELRTALVRLSPRAAELVAVGRALMQWHDSHGFCARCGAPSRVTLGGWQRFCPGCDTHHFPRTDPVVIMRITRGNRVLLGRSPGWPPGMYSCLAGFIEPGETVEAAVRREVLEETAVRVGRVRFLASQPWPFPTQLMLACEGQALNAEIRIDPAEIEDAQWISRERLAGVFAGTDPQIRAPRPGAVAGWMLREWLADHRI